MLFQYSDFVKHSMRTVVHGKFLDFFENSQNSTYVQYYHNYEEKIDI
jgi:hypothetical protein